MSGQIYKVHVKLYFKTGYAEENGLDPSYTDELGFARIPCKDEQIVPFLYPDEVFQIFNVRWIGTRGFKATPIVSAQQL